MDLVMLLLAFIAGSLSYYVLFGGSRSGPFEESIMKNLALGKRVIVSIDAECLIFELKGDRMTITRGMSTFMEEPYDPSLDNSDSAKSDYDNQISS